ncbi:MAG: response regulator transcription factor [Anaerolineae bacterium]|nr:response regulator transcription factor [Anaerolineae bacterium]
MSIPEHPLILVVDDERRMVHFVRMNLELEGFRVTEAYNGIDALDKVREAMPDLVLLDVAMPEMDGFETLARLREFSNVPVIMLTVRSEEEDRIRGLDLGADDYVTKPFSPRELASRIRAVLRRVAMTSSIDRTTPLEIDDYLTIDFPRRDVIVGGKRISLRPTEYRLLQHLVENAGWIVPHDQLLSKVWGPEYRDENQLLRLYITYLRKKIEPDPSHPRYIFTERGVGYRFVDFRRGEQDQARSLA